MEQGRLTPQTLERLVTDVCGALQLERLDVRLSSCNDGVAARPRAAVTTSDAYSRRCRHQRCQRLVLDLLQTSVRDAPADRGRRSERQWWTRR